MCLRHPVVKPDADTLSTKPSTRHRCSVTFALHAKFVCVKPLCCPPHYWGEKSSFVSSININTSILYTRFCIREKNIGLLSFFLYNRCCCCNNKKFLCTLSLCVVCWCCGNTLRVIFMNSQPARRNF